MTIFSVIHTLAGNLNILPRLDHCNRSMGWHMVLHHTPHPRSNLHPADASNESSRCWPPHRTSASHQIHFFLYFFRTGRSHNTQRSSDHKTCSPFCRCILLRFARILCPLPGLFGTFRCVATYVLHFVGSR